ncbi:hypothetical protein BO94DRAFT_601809 [Aspergillus sclerotioniger CBS 115572]|uniref:F-box domain-containing protein n=1 Tax=Aspergillus sclerotioniger CBS 115572 TaxID=1450535 RepID=A0A317WC80_9EURO|nr:hypothetical protein BO94DRAFT_601809 [Aspergillus sclerotioniger CBS 115572]PWY81740.1 hypothetical protein BO94DRAFT_601809 [Aspergillus sclerotioniger CBS 115572]
MDLKSEYTSICSLPNELLDLITSHLPNRDIKSLRLSCRGLSNVLPRLKRVFLSASPRNIEIFRNIADHEIHRHGVEEIIWDDALLRMGYLSEEERDNEDLGWEFEFDRDDARNPDLCPLWFAKACRENLEMLHDRKGLDVDRPDHIARALQVVASLKPLQVHWTKYRRLFDEQRRVFTTNADMDALRYGLEQFPSLKRITITPAAHGWLFNPLYETPMIRSFSEGFNYPIPRGWPRRRDWRDRNRASMGKEKQWRGCQAVMNLLAQVKEHHVTELVITDHELERGLDCNMFKVPWEEYGDLVSILKRPGFSRLDLALAAAKMDEADIVVQSMSDWPSFHNGNLRYALAQATDLEHIHLSACYIDMKRGQKNFRSMRRGMSLNAIFPVQQWPKLRHFGISNFVVTTDDVISFLKKLPETIRSVELKFLYFLDEGGSWPNLLRRIRDEVGWRARAVTTRPKLVLALEGKTSEWPARSIWIDEEVNEFLYKDGVDPFRRLMTIPKNGVGVERDLFEPEYERPYTTDVKTLERLGIVKEPKEVWFR